MNRRLLALAISLALVLSCAANAQMACHAPQAPRQVAQLLFGRKIGDRLGVSAAQFGHFVDREISARFPDGLTVFDAAGEWRDTARKTIVREPSKVVEIVLPGNDDDGERLVAIADAYKRRFHQQSVGMVIREACVSF
jgi:hypothetical protein